jgi:hypothetical protein
LTYAFYDGKKLELQTEDILAIKRLHGVPLVALLKQLIPSTEPKMCDLVDINTFLVFNQLLYIIRKKCVWTVDIGDMTRNTPRPSTDWLLVLLRSFESITAVTRRPSGEAVFFLGMTIHMVECPSLGL